MSALLGTGSCYVTQTVLGHTSLRPVPPAASHIAVVLGVAHHVQLPHAILTHENVYEWKMLTKQCEWGHHRAGARSTVAGEGMTMSSDQWQC